MCLACRKIVLRIIQFSNLCFCCAKMHHLFLTTGSIRSSCHKMTGFCHDRPCMHGGKCTEGWNRYICDCSQTSFSGATCGNGKKFKMILGMEFKGLAPETVYIHSTSCLVIIYRVLVKEVQGVQLYLSIFEKASVASIDFGTFFLGCDHDMDDNFLAPLDLSLLLRPCFIIKITFVKVGCKCLLCLLALCCKQQLIKVEIL